MDENKIHEATDLFGNYRIVPKKRQTERGELLIYFARKINKPIGYIAFKVTKLGLQDLYYIKSSCDSYEKTGNSWGKCFFGSLKPVDKSIDTW